MTKKIRKTGLCISWSLVFYFALAGCAGKKNDDSVSVQWEGSKAVGIIIPQTFLSAVSRDSIEELLHVRLSTSDQRIIGDYLLEQEKVLFRPIIALTRGLKYKVFLRKELIDEIMIPIDSSITAPEVLSIYPARDTLPENLLKFYVSFSKPMQQGDVLQHIHLIKDGRDTMNSVFLDLDLWNNEGTLLTLWLDPGRIKRDLQPNKLLGLPLQKGSNYELAIENDWQDAEGILLKQVVTKNFFIGPRDSISPDEELWAIESPRSETREQLTINFNEPLDHVLAESTIIITDANDSEVNGKLRVNEEGTVLFFLPGLEWKPGRYKLNIESRLEDLAGNNLGRLFDTDLTTKQQPSKKIHKREFEIK